MPEATRVAVGDVIDVFKKNMAGTLFDTVGVVELSYGKFGEFVVEYQSKEERKLCMENE